MILYHYCSNASFVGIVETRTIRLSELTLSNDSMEGLWLREVFSTACRDSDIPEHQIEELVSQLNSVIDFWSGLGFCLSEKPDVLSQWRGYADDGQGVSIGFDHDYLLEVKRQREEVGLHVIGFSKVDYDLDVQKQEIAPLIEHIKNLIDKGALKRETLLTEFDDEERKQVELARSDMRRFFGSFFLLLYTFKNPAFVEEQERRLIAWHPRQGVDGEHYKYYKELQYRAKNSHIVPYLELPLPAFDSRPNLAEVWLGPQNRTPDEVVSGMLEKHGFPNVQILRSKASYQR